MSLSESCARNVAFNNHFNENNTQSTCIQDDFQMFISETLTLQTKTGLEHHFRVADDEAEMNIPENMS